MSKKNEGKKKGNKGLKITLLSIFFILIFIIGFGGFYIFSTLNNMDKETIAKDNESIGIEKETLDKFEGMDDITNILLLGIDSRSTDYVGRSDSMMILTIDNIHNKLKLTSLMRDSYVDIDGHGKDKLNHAYAFGKGQLAIKTVNQNFQLNIKDFVAVDFNGLEDMIDALGGVNMTITNEELASLNSSITEQSRLRGVSPKHIDKAGSYNLNGIQAVAYARIRYASGGDYKRTERQRVVLEAMFNKIKNAGVTQFPAIANELLPNVRTSLSNMQVISLGTKVLSSGISGIEQQRFPLDKHSKGGYIGKVWYLQFDKDATREEIYNYLFNDIKPE